MYPLVESPCSAVARHLHVNGGHRRRARGKLDWRARASKTQDALGEFEDGDLFAIAGVEYPRESWRVCDKIQCGHNILYVDKVACLASVAEYRQRLPEERSFKEDRHSRGVGSRWVLTRPEDVEKTQCYCLETTSLTKLPTVELAVQFRFTAYGLRGSGHISSCFGTIGLLP